MARSAKIQINRPGIKTSELINNERAASLERVRRNSIPPINIMTLREIAPAR